MANFRVLQIESATRAEAVAFLSDSRRNEACVGRHHARDHRCWIFRRNQHLTKRADHAVGTLGVQNRRRIEPILRVERITNTGTVQRHGANAPAWILVQQVVEIVRLVDAVKGTGPEMHDANANGSQVILWNAHATRQARQFGARQK